jgi:AraC-like DNA-binding protein
MLKPRIQTSTLQGLPEVLRAHGVDPEAFLSRFGLSTGALLVRNEHITYWQYADVLREAALACALPHIGLVISQTATHRLYAEGALGILLKYCDTVGGVLEAITRYYHTVSGGADYRLEVAGDEAYFVREGRVAGLKHDRILQDISLCDFVAMLRKALGVSWQPTKVLFTYEAPEDTAPYDAILRAPVVFGDSRQAICFPAADLTREIAASKSLIEALVRDLVSRSLAQPGVPFAHMVEQAMDLLLPTGVCCANSVATAFDLHPRTLHRRLKREGVTFSGLLDARRKKHAAAYLENPAMPIAEVGIAVGYTAPEAFTRAFRRWYGLSPNQWRQQRRPET